MRYNLPLALICTILSALVATLITRSYAGIVRYTGIEDGKRIAISVVLGLAILCALNLLYYYNQNRNLIPFSIILISSPISFFLLFFYRLFVKELFTFIKSSNDSPSKVRVLIFGAGHLGLSVKQVIENTPNSDLKVLGWIEDDDKKVGKKVQGISIFHSNELDRLVNNFHVKEVIVAVNNLSLERKDKLMEDAVRLQIKVRMVPPADTWMKGELSLKQIKQINIEDLLGRDVITMENGPLLQEIEGRTVVITGGAGSIGGELSRQIARLHPRRLVVIDQAESALFEAEYELRRLKLGIDINFVICDINNRQRLRNIFKEHKPNMVFHAAAYKHVPLMENNPTEAITCNVLGTKVLADIAVEFEVEKFVMISTDKAVNPTSVMGCSKRIAEIYVQALNDHQRVRKTAFVTTRFGNVLGSNGSVIPIFRKQIENGGPLTVTHPDVTRYFMTIPEACRLVLEAGAMGKGGEIFIFDMGKPVRIADLARKMVLLSGLELGKDIEIVFTGLREGEKLYEELLAMREDTIPTHHHKIVKAKVAAYPYQQIEESIQLIEELIHDKNELKIVALMKEIIPEYRSNYSRFEVLDQ